MDKLMKNPLGLCQIINWIGKGNLKFFILGLLFLNATSSNASHIVGGEISYRCLGGNEFEVSLTVYRDCEFGNAPFDSLAAIGIFDVNNNLVTSINGGQLLIPSMVEDTLNIILSDTCLFAPNNICVNSMTYRDTVTLPTLNGGYQLVYQRCCRNQSISNIISSFDTGATFMVDISDAALSECNTSPIFNVMPPVYLCVNEPFVFDQSVIDVDGDSLAYSLCTPFDGASIFNPQPQPPSPPPYNEILWQSPPYGLNNLLGGVPLEIDAETGLLTGTPNTQGLFLVGICIEEYRNGQLISTSRREFQYNVGICNQINANFQAPASQCDFEVDFVNTSFNADDFLWVFNDSGNPGATSTEINPSFTFSDTGTYEVMLIAEPNNFCSDTTFTTITLEENTIDPSFVYTTLSCTDSAEIVFVNTSIDSDYDIIEWFWELSDGQTSTQEVPLFIINSSQTLIANLTVTNSNGCQAEVFQIIPINLIPSTLLETEITICRGDTILLNPNAPLGLPFKYSWSPEDYLNDSETSSPLASPEEDITYILTIIDTLNNCEANLETSITVLDDPDLEIEISSSICAEFITLTAITDAQGEYLWSDNLDFNNVLSDSSSVSILAPTATTYYLQFLAGGICETIDSITIQDQSINVSLSSNLETICVGDTAIFIATNNNPSEILSYTWFISSGFVVDVDSIFQIIPLQPSEQTIYFQAENQFGCTYLDSVHVNALNPAASLFVETNQDCGSLEVDFTLVSGNSDYYEWIFITPSGNDTLTGENITYTFPAEGTYTYSLVPIVNLDCELPTEDFEITVGESTVNAGFTWEYISCEDPLSIQFTDTSTTLLGNIVEWEWLIGDVTSVNDQNPAIDLGPAQTLEITLTVTTEDGCTNTHTEEIEFSITNIGDFESQAVICDGTSIQLNPLGNPDLNYEWSPAQFLNDPNSVSPIATPPVTTIFEVTITDPTNNDCVIEKSVEVVVPEIPIEANFTYDIIECEDEVVTIAFNDASTSSSAINNWFWIFPNNQFSNDQNTVFEVDTGTTLIVQFQVQTIDGCTDITSDTIEIEGFSFSLPQNEILKCTGLPVNLNPGANPNFTYSWSPSSTLNNVASPNPIANPSETTEYCVTVTNGTCIQESCVTVIVPDIPLMADFSYSISDCINEANIFFQDQTQNSFGNIISWNWTFSNGLTTTEQNPIITITNDTTITATLEVVTSEGCESEYTEEVVITLLDFDIPDQITLCEGTPVQLNQNGNQNHNYLWSPSSGLTDNDVPSPFAFPLTTTNYTVTITDGDCEIIQSVLVVVPDVPLEADFSFTIDDCSDIAEINFTDESIYSPGGIAEWNWQFSNGDSSDQENPLLTLDESQLLEVTLNVITEDGCEAFATQQIDINLIDINIPDTIVNCNSVGVELNPGGDPTITYVWSPSNGLSSTSGANPIANPTSTTNYSVTVSDGPCQIIRSIEVTVPDEDINAEFSFTFDDCTDNAIIEFSDETDFPNNSITDWDWTFTGNSTSTSDLQNPILILNQSDTIIAELTVTTIDGCTSTTSQVVEVNLIDINISGSVIYCNSSGVVLNPNGNTIYDYSWSPSNGLSATDVASPIVTGLTQTTNYSVTVTFGNCVLVRNIEILIPDIPLEADFGIEYATCIDSSTIQFLDQSVYSGNIIEWDWLINSQTYDVQNPTVTFFENDMVNAQLVVTTAHGCRDTLNNSFDIVVMDDVNIPEEVATCNGNGTFLNPNSNPNYQYSWSPSIGLNGNTQIANPFANPDSSIIYTVEITNTGIGCIEELSVAYNVPTEPLIAGFEWEYLSCSDSAEIVFIDTTNYTGLIESWSWEFENGFVDSTQNTSFVFQDIDMFDVQLMVTSNDGCVDSITTTVDIEIINISTMPDTIQLCNDTSTFLNPNGNPDLFYTWSPSSTLDAANVANPFATPLQSTEYVVTITSPNNIFCNEVRTVEVLVATDPIDLDWSYPADTIICTSTIELIASSQNAVDYSWSDQPDFQNELGIDPDFVAIPNNTGTYYIQVSDNAGCTITDSILVTSYSILADLDEEITLCFGDSIQLEVILGQQIPGVDLQYTWDSSEGILSGDDTSTPLISPSDSTEYALMIENQFGCEYTDTVQINVLDLEILVEVFANKDTIGSGEEVQLFATDSPDWDYTWTPSESLNSDNISNPIAIPEEATTYTVLIEDKTNGCKYLDSVSIFILDDLRCREPFVFIPKGFTPNDDGLNDLLFVRGNYIEEMEFVIVNRWGEKVFETKDQSIGWDGKVNGKIVPPDVFGYYLSYKCNGGQEYILKGNVTLIR